MLQRTAKERLLLGEGLVSCNLIMRQSQEVLVKFKKKAKKIRWSTIVMITLFIASIFIFAHAEAAVKCKVTIDRETITGLGLSRQDAFDDAATQCFDMKSKNFRKRQGREIDELNGVAIIDECANVRCTT